MKQEDKVLLLNELSARAPYGVNCLFKWSYINETTDGEEVIAGQIDTIKSIDFHTKEVEANYYGEWVGVEDCKPYLRPMSSMTFKEIREFLSVKNNGEGEYLLTVDKQDWLNKHHFDYQGLIEKGLALEAPNEMYKTE